jgi:hypothetical protein
MELAIYRKQNKYKIATFIMVAICVLCIVPNAILLASALTDPTIEMSGVNNSELTIGRTGVNGSDQLLDYNGADWHVNPTEQPLMLIIPLVFFAVALLLLIQMALSEDKSISNLIYAAILIIMALALLTSVQFNINSLLGG